MANTQSPQQGQNPAQKGGTGQQDPAQKSGSGQQDPAQKGGSGQQGNQGNKPNDINKGGNQPGSGGQHSGGAGGGNR